MFINKTTKFIQSITYSMIVARDSSNGIGFKNGLPWPKCQSDMKWFRDQTMSKIIIMGRSTFESIGSKPLPGRINIVISTTLDESVGKAWNAEYQNDTTKGYLVIVDSVEKAKKFINDTAGMLHGGGEVMVIGGAQIYQAFWNDMSRVYLTTFNGSYTSDVQIEFSLEHFDLVYLDKRRVLDPQFQIFDCVKDNEDPLTITRKEIKQCLKSLTN